MTLLELRVSSLLLTDVNRRSLYASLTLFGKTVWIQWWPRPIYDGSVVGQYGIRVTRRPFLTVGTR